MKVINLILAAFFLAVSLEGQSGNGSSVHTPTATNVDPYEFHSIKDAVTFKRQIEIMGEMITPKKLRGANQRFLLEGKTKEGLPLEFIIRVNKE